MVPEGAQGDDPPLIDQWQEVIGVEVNEWGVKRMKTKWGSCNINARRIWLNLELAKKPVQCLGPTFRSKFRPR